MRKRYSSAGATLYAQPPVLEVEDVMTGDVVEHTGKWIGPVRHVELAQAYYDIIASAKFDDEGEVTLESKRELGPPLIEWAITYLREMGFGEDVIVALPDGVISDAALGFFAHSLRQRDPGLARLLFATPIAETTPGPLTSPTDAETHDGSDSIAELAASES